MAQALWDKLSEHAHLIQLSNLGLYLRLAQELKQLSSNHLPIYLQFS